MNYKGEYSLDMYDTLSNFMFLCEQ